MDGESGFEQAEEIKLQERLEKLEMIGRVLGNMGLKVQTRFINKDSLRDGMPDFPIVSDGLDGVRISIDSQKGLLVWFTNGFEDQDNMQRLEIERNLRESGLL